MKENLIRKNKLYYQNRISLILRNLESIKGSVLDLGCGEMILKNYLNPATVTDYLGVDNISFVRSEDFILSDVIEFIKHSQKSFDYIFAIGLIDHLDLNKSQEIIRWGMKSCSQGFILSISNGKNIFLQNNTIQELAEDLNEFKRLIYLCKFPFFQKVFSIPSDNWFVDVLATEVILIYRKS